MSERNAAGRRRQATAKRAVRRASANRDAARRQLLAKHRALARQRARNRRRSVAGGGQGGDPPASPDREDGDANGPHSTVPPTDSNAEVASGGPHSTVPEHPRGSDAPRRTRLYGPGLYLAARGEGGETDG